MKLSMMRVELIVIEMHQNLLPKFKIAETKKKHMDALEFWDQELHQDTKEYHAKLSRVIRKDLSTVH